jgi:hypothetical protein
LLDNNSVGCRRIYQLCSEWLLLRADVHALFDTYDLSINPDVGFLVFYEEHNDQR